ncbi:hypothetical protein [Nonomuraea sp. NPDC050783]|uniref:hypothetical protein n=1 Tax=Nonomuraea sp. NPDC050783 TaxID=3154634 RepID=UPI0034661C1F
MSGFAGGLAINQQGTSGGYLDREECRMGEEMATVIRPDETSETRPCSACRGRGMKSRTSRRALLVADEEFDSVMGGERVCLDCLGEGQVEGSEK